MVSHKEPILLIHTVYQPLLQLEYKQYINIILGKLTDDNNLSNISMSMMNFEIEINTLYIYCAQNAFL